ncbi:MAG: adenylyl cyclase [Myxococcota bacterium]
MERIQQTLNALHRQRAQSEFSESRTALLFMPGTYRLDVTADYYVQVSGLGQTPDAVRIDGAVQSIATTQQNRVTLMFWRSAENMAVYPTDPRAPIRWAVSQAAPYRRMHIHGDLRFDMGGWASGGYLANSRVEGEAGLRTGQQWFTRNAELGRWKGGNWNQTFVGTRGTPRQLWPDAPVTVIDETPVIRDKPFWTVDASGEFSLFVPALTRNTAGVSWSTGEEAGVSVPMHAIYLGSPHRDSSATLNAALANGKHLILTPGTYLLDAPLQVRRPGAIVMGMGFATLVPTQGDAAIRVADVDGVTLSSLLIDAGPTRSRALVEIGPPGADQRHADDPTVIHDLFCRVGGARVGQTDACLVIHSHDVIVDHAWLWRADHGAGARWSTNRARNGLLVHGDDVTIYGLFNEHFQEHQALWSGERGRVYFYQSEMPYDPPDQDHWRAGDRLGFAAYKVAADVQQHDAWGLGIYSFFGVHQDRDPNVRASCAVEVPRHDGVRVTHLTIFAGETGGIDHPLNDLGGPTDAGSVQFFDGVPQPAPTRGARQMSTDEP